MKAVFSLIFLSLTFNAAIQTFAQSLDPNNKSKSGKTLVSVPVSVSDRSGRYISGLQKKDFSVYQDGAKQEIVSFATEEEPVSVVLLLDTSQSTKKVIGKIKDAAKDFIDILNPRDKCLIATFDSQVSLLSSFNSDKEQLKNALKKVTAAAGTGTVMRKAVNQIAQNSFSRVEGRKALIILSDGKDFGSFITRDELMDVLQESDVMIYTVFYKTGLNAVKPRAASGEAAKTAKPKRVKNQNYGVKLSVLEGNFPTQAEIDERERKSEIEAIETLKGMSDVTAGRFYLRDVTNLGKTFEQIAAELREQYRIGFYQTETAASADRLHQVRVKVADPEMVVRSRGTFKAKSLRKSE